MQIDYKKYVNMSEKQLLNSLSNIDEKMTKLKVSTQEKLKDFIKLKKFLKTQLKNRIDKEFIPYEKSTAHKLAQKLESSLSNEEKAEINKELKRQIHGL
ncbi:MULTISPECIES: hypothetical protein [unclassified Campylobacter]|uniref:hypothetical protein n=1 Tax=unclassified Campylobacter TaxID=2593542 RepID=UPI0012382F35|nr:MULTISPECIES: hypothetical protein [unclassified Campylobacter]KAA6226256.1 hypothetical protein FMM55_05190 [Campylobacter sp. LR196d]KAA6226686.1 hypothetical protein FMM57_05375 [Campylobacter sp. LR286c]KAA6227718.1 hypothetical protein FMM54_02280 [Campylobacter sp. LR185c]KAA6231249.1 hypothetical protein FMM58_03550 [Campylobacter sp. LR291e]KAA6234138.1 hypothetical protein FMM56_01480 [Campylobacter sp. LR264d]